MTIAAVTANLARVYPPQVMFGASETGRQVDSKAHAEQIRSVAVERVGQSVGVVPPAVMHALDDALGLHLSM